MTNFITVSISASKQFGTGMEQAMPTHESTW